MTQDELTEVSMLLRKAINGRLTREQATTWLVKNGWDANAAVLRTYLPPAEEPGTAHGRHIPPHTSESVAEPAPEPKCATCGDDPEYTHGRPWAKCPDCGGEE